MLEHNHRGTPTSLCNVAPRSETEYAVATSRTTTSTRCCSATYTCLAIIELKLDPTTMLNLEISILWAVIFFICCKASSFDWNSPSKVDYYIWILLWDWVCSVLFSVVVFNFFLSLVCLFFWVVAEEILCSSKHRWDRVYYQRQSKLMVSFITITDKKWLVTSLYTYSFKEQIRSNKYWMYYICLIFSNWDHVERMAHPTLLHRQIALMGGALFLPSSCMLLMYTFVHIK